MNVSESLTCPIKGSEGTREGKITETTWIQDPSSTCIQDPALPESRNLLYLVETSIAIKTDDMAHLLNKNLNSCFNEIQCWQINIKMNLVSS